MKIIILALLLFATYSINAQVSPDIINANLNRDTFKNGEEAVLTVFKIAGPENPNITLSIDANLITPDSTVTPVDIKKVTNEIYMALSKPLNQNGQHVFNVKAYIGDERVINPLKTLIVDLKEEICHIEIQLEIEKDPSLREILLRKKSKLEVDLLIAKTNLEDSRYLIQEEQIAFNVSGNSAPLAQIYGVEKITADTLYQDEKYSTRYICVNGTVLDPDDGGNYEWEIDFGDGNQIKFNNLSSDFAQNSGCVVHSYFGNQRPLVTFKAVDKEGAFLILSGILDIRTHSERPLPYLKVTNLQKISITDSSGNFASAIELTFDPMKTRVPSNSGIRNYHILTLGTCENVGSCPYEGGGSLKKMVFKITEKGNYTFQYFVKDNLQNTRIVESILDIDPAMIPDMPTKEFRDELFGPSAIIQVNRSSVVISDPNVGSEVKFDGSASFDFSGDDTKLKYYWDFGDGFSGSNYSNSKKTSHFYKKPGTYYASFYVVDEHGNKSLTDFLHITVLRKDAKEISPMFMAYRQDGSQQVMFSVMTHRLISPVPSEIYYWDFGDGSGSVTNSATPIKTYSTPGTYEVSVTFQDMTGKFVTAKKTIDTNNTDPVPTLGDGIRITPWDFVKVNENATFDASSTEMNSFLYSWWLPNGVLINGGPEEAVQNLIFKENGINHIRLDITNSGGFSSEFAAFLPSGDKKLEISNVIVSEVEDKTQVNFSVTIPSEFEEIERIEIFNFADGWTVVENPDSLNISETINGISSPVVILLTDIYKNQNIFFYGFTAPLPEVRERTFPISDVMMKYINTSNEYGKFLTRHHRFKE